MICWVLWDLQRLSVSSGLKQDGRYFLRKAKLIYLFHLWSGRLISRLYNEAYPNTGTWKARAHTGNPEPWPDNKSCRADSGCHPMNDNDVKEIPFCCWHRCARGELRLHYLAFNCRKWKESECFTVNSLSENEPFLFWGENSWTQIKE